MVVHAGTHLKSDPHAAAQLCGKCLSFAPLQNMAGGGAVVIPAVQMLHDHAIDAVLRADAPRGAFAAFRSRAPPRSF